MTPLVLADLMRGTGRFNVSLGAVATVQGIGASFSNTVAGLIVVSGGYGIAFLTLATVALAACMGYLLAMPETAKTAQRNYGVVDPTRAQAIPVAYARAQGSPASRSRSGDVSNK